MIPWNTYHLHYCQLVSWGTRRMQDWDDLASRWTARTTKASSDDMVALYYVWYPPRLPNPSPWFNLTSLLAYIYVPTYFLRLLPVVALLIPAKKRSEIEAIQGESTIFQVHSCMHNGEKWMTQNEVHGHSTVKSKYCHVLSPCGWQPPCPTLSACAEPISHGHCRK